MQAAPAADDGPGADVGVEVERPEVQALARSRFVAAFLEQSPRSHWGMMPTALLVTVIWARGQHLPWALAWLTAVLAMLAWRLTRTQAFVLGAAPDRQPRRIEAMLLVSGVLYALPLLGFGVMDQFGRAALTMILLAIATLSIINTSGYRGIHRAFAWPLLGGAVLAWCWYGWQQRDPVPALLGLTILCFAAFLETVGRHASAVFLQSCAWRFGEQQRNEQLQQALAAADQANQAKTQFLAAASHDLRQPMHSMSVLVAALSLRPLDAPTREIVALLGSVNQALSRQLDTLLDMSKLDAGLVRAARSPQRLDRLVREHHAALAPVAAEHGLRLDCDASQPVWVDTDPSLLGRVLSNLTDNAIKYTPAGGRVGLTVRTDAAHAWVEVADSGIGIAAADTGRVFREFFQVGNVERDRSKGLGLGLSIVQRLCRLLDVDLTLASTPGRGTTVTLRLARSTAIGTAAADAPSAAAVPAGLRVLVVDDEADVRRSMRLLLEGLGCTVQTADGIAQARAAGRGTPLDLVLSDLRLRDGDSGVAAIDAVREGQPGVAAALITGDTAPERLRELEASGLRVLFKPVALAQLLAVMPAAAVDDTG